MSVLSQTAMNVTLILLGILSAAMCYVHWRVSIVPLYKEGENEERGDAEESREMRDESEDQL